MYNEKQFITITCDDCKSQFVDDLGNWIWISQEVAEEAVSKSDWNQWKTIPTPTHYCPKCQ